MIIIIRGCGSFGPNRQSTFKAVRALISYLHFYKLLQFASSLAILWCSSNLSSMMSNSFSLIHEFIFQFYVMFEEINDLIWMDGSLEIIDFG